MDITFKNATVFDIDKVFELNKKLICDYETNTNIDYEKVFNWVQAKIENNIEKYNCIYKDGVKVGYYYLHNEGDKLELDDLYIFEEFQGLGIGTYILNYIDLVAKEQDRVIFLYVFVKNQRAVNLYLKHGYEVIKNIRDSRYIMSKK